MSRFYRAVPVLNFIRSTAIQGLEKDAEEVDFSSRICQLKIPVALFVGKNKEARIPSNISQEILQLYKNEIPNLNIVEFSKSGHMIPDDETDKYIEEIAAFINLKSI